MQLLTKIIINCLLVASLYPGGNQQLIAFYSYFDLF